MASPGGSDGAPTGKDLPQPSRSRSSSNSRSSINSTLGTKLENAKRLSIEHLEVITDNFSPERVIGRGGYGTVYKGLQANGKNVAVKVLHKSMTGIDNGEFKHEFERLMRLKHHNIIQLVGYCYETQHKPMLHDGETIFTEDIYKALCFDYMQNGSLKEHISVECDGLEWHTRYKIIKGTCEGLKYLHEEFKEPIYHLDLKPENILLDDTMVPKLADFGSSKLFSKELTTVIPQHLAATTGYVPPEYYSHQVVSKKFDIFSLGVVMAKIIAGPRGNSLSAEMDYQDFLDQVHENWRKRLEETWHNSELLQAYCQQVNICTTIALSCMDYDRFKRPAIMDIIDKLNETETVIEELDPDQQRTRYIAPEQVPVQFRGLFKEDGPDFTTSDSFTELTIKACSKETIEIPVTKNSTIVWELRVVGWEVSYGAEFTPDAEWAYTVIVEKTRKVRAKKEPIMKGSFKASEAGKMALMIINVASKKKKLLYRSKVKRTGESVRGHNS